MFNSTQNNRNQNVGIPFFVILALVAVLIITLIIVAIVDMMPERNTNNTAINKDSETESQDIETEQPSKDVLASTTPVSPTKESRTSYIIGKSPEAVQLTDEIKSSATVLVELGEYNSIVEKNADTKMYPASMTKVMTLIIACENIKNLNESLSVTQEIADYMKDNDGSGAGLKIGESYLVEDLLYLIAYQSDTMACLLIADHVAGSEEAFVALMNKKANDLGLTGTHFTNCTGLYNAEHYTTCREMAAIMAYAMDNELAYNCLSSYRGRPMAVGGVNCTFYANWYSGRDRFADNPNLKTTTVVAGKTGYTDESGFTFVTVAKGDNGKMYINVIVGLPKGSGLSESMLTSEVKKIYNTYVTK